MTSMPVWNLTPLTTFDNWFSPFNRRQVFAAAVTSLNTMSLAVIADRDPLVRTVRWFNLAAARGNKDAVKGRDMVAAKMTPAQLAEAQKLAREWKPTSTPTPR
jgi:hypothetical protein